MKNTLLFFTIILSIFGKCIAIETTDTDLLEAVRNNDVAKVKSLLKQGASPDAVDFKGGTPAYEIALLAGYFDVLNSLTVSGANTLATTKLMIACRKGDVRAVKQVIAKKVDAKQRDEKGNDALYFAIIADSSECTSVLIQNGYSVNNKNKEGNTPIFAALSPTMLNFLLIKGADLNVRNNYNETPLFFYTVEGKVDLVRVALDLGADPNVVDKGGRTVLGWVMGECERGDPRPYYFQIIAILKAKGAKEVGKDNEG